MTTASTDGAAQPARAGDDEIAPRPARATGARADAEGLRRAYLELLKLALCDLVGPSTVSVGAMPDGTVLSRELRGEAADLRAAGMDWPLQGLTMVGLRRLDDLQACVESVVADGIAGDLVEAGAWRGGASILMRATLDSLGDERTVCVADSFAGFAPTETARENGIDLSAYDFLAAPLDEVRASFARLGYERGVEFVPGFFEESLAALSGRRWALLRLDADAYEPTREALRALYPGLSVGGYLVVDDYGLFEGCRRAIDEFRREHGIEEPLERIDATGVRWRRRTEAGPEPAAAAAAAEPSPAPWPAAPARRRDSHVPSVEEVQIARDLAAVRERLAAAEAEIDRLTGAPWRGPRAWGRRWRAGR
jgi:O-methyltransferase